MTARVDLALLLGKASEFARQWQTQQGCNAHVLDDLADAVVSYLGDNPQLAQAGGEALRFIDDPVRALDARPEESDAEFKARVQASLPPGAPAVVISAYGSPLIERLQQWLDADVGARRALFESVVGTGMSVWARVELQYPGPAGQTRTGIAATYEAALQHALDSLPDEVRP